MTSLWIKLCGMTSPEAVAAALESGADAIGFVFAPSVRRVTPAHAAELAAPARGRLACVAVTQHPTTAELQQILEQFAPDLLQTDHADLAALVLPPTLEVLPVLRIGASLPDVLPHRALCEGARSGSGHITDWTQAATLARRMQLVLAGGLHSENVAAAIRAVSPYGVDASSGLESAPGVKSAMKIREFVRAARAAHVGVVR
jgi:phosphoribosylanthranilate isomerase